MADFKLYAPTLSKWEGGYGNYKEDTGGPTMRGITIATFRQYFGANKTVADLKAMTDAQWEYIMKGQFWDKCGADNINDQKVAEIFVDWCINSGIAHIKDVQRMVGTKADGIVGKMTLAAINNTEPRHLFICIKIARARHFCMITEQKRQYEIFFDGWINRLADFQYKKK